MVCIWFHYNDTPGAVLSDDHRLHSGRPTQLAPRDVHVQHALRVLDFVQDAVTTRGRV